MRSLFGLMVCTVAASFELAAQSAPSQLELNGFFIGQHRSAITAAFGKPFKEERTPDGWTYQVYVVDQPRGVYMVFEYDDARPNNVISLQLTGDSSKKVLPFLGLRLGADTNAVRRVLGAPTSRREIDEPKLTLWDYRDRNYSVEFTAAGRLYSVQLMGYDGFPAATPDLPLAKFRAALATGRGEELIPFVAPDIEIFRDSAVIAFTGAMRGQLTDSASAIARELLYGPRSLRSVLEDSTTWVGSDQAMRMHERPRPGAVYRVIKFSPSTPLAELVFEGLAGEWRLWEVAWR